MRAACLLALLTASCSYTFDGDAPEAQLIGTAPDMTKFPRINNGPVTNEGYILGLTDGNYWFWMKELPATFHAYTIPNFDRQDSFTYDSTAQDVYVYTTAFFTIDHAVDTTTPVKLSIRGPGAAKPDAVFMIPPGQLSLGTSSYEDVLYYWVQAPTTTTFHLFRRDGTYERDIPIPDGVDPTTPSQLIFTSDSGFLIARDAKNRLISHSTISEVDVDLGVRPTQLVESSNHSFITAGMDGIRRMMLDGAADVILDPQPVDDKPIIFHAKSVYYSVNGALWSVLLDGTGTPHVEPVASGFQRILGWAPDGTLMYSTDPSDRYIYGAGDGWLGPWNFMERGRDAFFNSDATRLRWLEHAAQTTGVGDLLSSPIGGPPVRLARNVAFSEQLGDGRLLALANFAELGTWNRIIAIDEKTNLASWIAVGTGDFELITDQEMLVDVITGATGHDVLRVPIPALPALDGGM